MRQFVLELYFETNDVRELATRESGRLRDLVAELAPHVVLEVRVLKARSVARNTVGSRDVPYHPATQPGHQTLLITAEDIGAEGWGWPGCGAVSKTALENKLANGGNPADITIHEWLHTIYGQVIGGRAVPFVDSAEAFGFGAAPGLDGELTWHDWYRYALGG